MAANLGPNAGDGRRAMSSPRPKGRDQKNTVCRNVSIYGHCRYEHTCPYVHDAAKLLQNENVKKRFNADSPSFTPLQTSTNGSLAPAPGGTAISPKAANAAVFTPQAQRSTSTPLLHPRDAEWHPQDVAEFVPAAEFVPQAFDAHMVGPSADAVAWPAAPVDASSAQMLGYDAYGASTPVPSLGGGPAHSYPDPSGAAAYFANAANTFQSTPSFHLYWPIGPQLHNLQPYQKTAHDLFVPEALREELQRKSEAARRILPNSSLPPIEQYHSLVCLDTTQHKSQSVFGYPSWVYKAVSSKDGHTYALRRLEGFRLTSENAIRSVQAWKRVSSGSVVTVHDAFTTRAFGDSSLIVVTDYHACSKSVAEEHFKTAARGGGGHGRGVTATPAHVSEQVLWSYVVQLASALKAIHSVGLAARLVVASKVLLTSKHRVRLNGCAVLDAVHAEHARPLAELQADDLVQLGKLVLCVATGNPNAGLAVAKSVEHVSRTYGSRMRDCVQWLLQHPATTAGSPTSPTSPGGGGAVHKDIDAFLTGIADKAVAVLDSTLHAEDHLVRVLGRELESSRLVRLLTKLNFVNERPELDARAAAATPVAWSETGERYYLKLFRDFVFHQVDGHGHPVTDLGHVLDCLNKLDAGSDERVALVSRDDVNVLLVSYRELKRGLDGAFQELVQAGRPGR